MPACTRAARSLTWTCPGRRGRHCRGAQTGRRRTRSSRGWPECSAGADAPAGRATSSSCTPHRPRPGSTLASRRCGGATPTGSPTQWQPVTRSGAPTCCGTAGRWTSRRWTRPAAGCRGSMTSRRTASPGRVPRPSGPSTSCAGSAAMTAWWRRPCARTPSATRWCGPWSGPASRWGRGVGRSTGPPRCLPPDGATPRSPWSRPTGSPWRRCATRATTSWPHGPPRRAPSEPCPARSASRCLPGAWGPGRTAPRPARLPRRAGAAFCSGRSAAALPVRPARHGGSLGSMSEPAEDTPATSPDPQWPGEGDSNQLPKEDTLEQRGVDDLLEEGYSPPERDPLRGENLTEAELIEGDTHTERLEAEEPEVWEEGDQPAASREPDRSWRIEAVTEEAAGPGGEREQSAMAEDVGVAGGAATAEEAAMRERDEADPIGLTGEGGTPG